MDKPTISLINSAMIELMFSPMVFYLTLFRVGLVHPYHFDESICI